MAAVVLAGAALATILPFLWMLGVALRPASDLYAHPASILPGHWSLDGFRAVVDQLPFGRLVLNTFVFAGGTCVLLLFFDSLTAYALARLEFRGKNALFVLILATLMVPFQVTLIPVFLTLFHLGWLNTEHGLILPRATSALGIFMLRQFFVQLPKELDEAARIDGAGPWTIYWRIILPLSKPALASLFVIQFAALWNDFLWPLVVTSDPSKRTLPAALTMFSSSDGVDHAALMAGAAISLSPLALAFLLAQRFFVQGVAASGLK
ncbi:carbohydrate ABC transporter membrane protein 2 (CUT1 family) [Motilibacter rhizosphaerae]|uniref:Carbohydrate ABC transporter membrane protein 2 (CUT1 family) n=1 Tax=Motilibacter rhizosphaerae TaxID=598652 RepID=A0A4Q7NNQ8_9ACTN|nr:carbohydrate ABC transporter permease [Motilibacter rhizosphaerae]RZS86871.1 carbohydrate ABC transporter membrane protein 2 (CUT1 family) [Motilibacter rhizosphaerae]